MTVTDDKLLFLKSHVVARGLSDDALQEIANAAELIRLAPGDFVRRHRDAIVSLSWLHELQNKTSQRRGKLDAAVAAISVTSDRLDRVDFCHPHFSTGLGIAVSTRERTIPCRLLRRVVSSRLVNIVMAMVLLVAVCGFLFWLFERKTNTSMFGGKRRQGLGMEIWWSTILLFGHKGIIPVSTMGRLLATLAMFASLIVISILTGVITSVLTVVQLDTGIKRSTDLHDVRVATVIDSVSADCLSQRRIFLRGYETPREAIEAVDADTADAVVYDTPRENVLHRRLNQELLRFRENDAWDGLVYHYLGE